MDSVYSNTHCYHPLAISNVFIAHSIMDKVLLDKQRLMHFVALAHNNSLAIYHEPLLTEMPKRLAAGVSIEAIHVACESLATDCVKAPLSYWEPYQACWLTPIVYHDVRVSRLIQDVWFFTDESLDRKYGELAV